MDADKRQAAELLAQEAGKFEIELSETQISKLLAFGELVMEGNKRLNLMASWTGLPTSTSTFWIL